VNPTIEITVDRKGQSRIETRGFTGTSCRVASQYLEEALGVRGPETLTAEYYQDQHQSDPLRQSS
jgi:hypothetical protein